MKNLALMRMSVCALFAALLCVISPIAILIGPVPISLSVFAVLLSASLLGAIWGTVSVSLYLLLGALGLPVFGGGMAGFGALLGPTGGFLWSYLIMSLMAGFGYRRIREKSTKGARWIGGLVTGTLSLIPCYLLGSFQYSLVANVSFLSAMAVCVLPFLIFDLCKIVLVCIIFERIMRIADLRRVFFDLFG